MILKETPFLVMPQIAVYLLFIYIYIHTLNVNEIDKSSRKLLIIILKMNLESRIRGQNPKFWPKITPEYW